MSSMTVVCVDIVEMSTTTILMLLFISIERALRRQRTNPHLLMNVVIC